MEIGWIDSPERWRDFFLMCFTVAGTILFLVGIIFTVVIGWLTTSTLLRTRRILKNNVQPALVNVRETTASVRGTVSFISDAAVKPVVRVYSVYAGARRFVTVFVRLRKPRRAT